MNNVIELPTKNVPPYEVINGVLEEEENIKDILVICKMKDGSDVFFSSSAQKSLLHYMASSFAFKILNGNFDLL